MSSAMSSPVKRWLLAALAIGVVIGVGPAGLTAPASAAQHPHDPDIIINTSGDRTSSVNGTATGGSVSGVQGVRYDVTTLGGAFVGTCTSNAIGTCAVPVTGGATYRVTQVSAPTGNTPAEDNYFISPALGVGATGSISRSGYNSIDVTVGTSNVTIPTPSTATSSVTVRSGRWAVSRYNPPPPTTCTRSVALLFDLSASITSSELADYKTSVTGFVRALLGTSTNVTLYTFGTAAPAPGAPNATFGPRNTLTTAGVNELVGRISGLTLPTTAQYTNWDAGIWQIAASGVHYNEAIVLTDGDPTAISANGLPDATGVATTRFRAVENGIFSANALKDEGTRVIAVGIADNAHPGSVDNLKAISGPEEGSDYFIIPFDSLDGLLTDLALAHCASLEIAKSAHPTTYDHVGQTITYTYHVTNTSPHDGFTLHGITVHDDRLGTITNCTPDTLAPGEVATCTATHVIDQADIDAGSVMNTAVATGETPNHDTVTSPPDDEIVTAVRHPDIEITKTAHPARYTVGETITYTYTVRNTGNVTLHDVMVIDSRLGAITDCDRAPPVTLAPGEEMTCHATHTATQADVDAGRIHNTATATGHPPGLPPVTDHDDAEVTAERHPAIDITKTATPTTFTGAGETITYSFVVTNTGNVTLHDVTVHDSSLGAITDCDRAAPVTLAPGAVMTCTASHVTTVADADAGSIHNTATATGRPEVGPPVTDEDSAEVIGTGRPGIEVTKAVAPTTFSAPGEMITYSYTVTNIGAVTLTGVTVIDSELGTIACTPATLTPGASATCPTATHVTTQADVDAGSIHNTVTATGTPPTGPNVSDEAQETVTGEQIPAIEIIKTASPQEYTRPGQVITYHFVVTNTGNVTLQNVTVTDTKLAAITHCDRMAPVTLVPGAAMTCIATHVTTQADVDAGSIANTATATGHPEVGPPVTDESPAEVTAGFAPSLEITKTASPLVYSMHGQLIAYTYTVSNTGNVTLRDIMLTDTRYGPIGCPLTTLAPGESTTCTFIHAISATDLDEGSIFNSSAATGHPPFGPPVRSKPAHATVVEEIIKLPEVPVTG